MDGMDILYMGSKRAPMPELITGMNPIRIDGYA
jgi:hypothetical protein